jgi:sarcosine oxidase
MAVTRQVLHWFDADDTALFAAERCPVFIWMHGDTAEQSFYGFPVPHDGAGVKVAMEQYLDILDDPDLVRREVAPAEALAMFDDHVQGRLVGMRPTALRSAICLYTMTPDADFLIAPAPENPRVLLVSACSGHGFKHSAALGEAVARRLTGGDDGILAPFAADRLISG